MVPGIMVVQISGQTITTKDRLERDLSKKIALIQDKDIQIEGNRHKNIQIFPVEFLFAN